jgi:acetylglutamate kinase
METAIKKADVLVEALPYIKKFRGKTFVIKYGGSILAEESIRKSVLEDIVFLYFMGIDVILVHGGGPNINARLKEAGIPSDFFEGVRVTDARTLKIVQEELRNLNDLLTNELSSHQALAKGLEGSDDIIYVKKKPAAKDLGYVGEVTGINHKALKKLAANDHLTVLLPTGVDKTIGQVYNVNADETAAAVAGGLDAEKFIFLTDVQGVMRDPKDPASFISSADEKEIKHMIDTGVISGGMIPKVKSCLSALDKGAKKVHIIDAKIPHALLLEIFTDKGVGTEIIK